MPIFPIDMNASAPFLIPIWTAIITGLVARAWIRTKGVRIISRFREVGANDKGHTLALKELEDRNSWIVNQLINGKVLVAVADGRYYLDEEGLIRHRKRQRTIKLIVLGIVLLALFLLCF